MRFNNVTAIMKEAGMKLEEIIKEDGLVKREYTYRPSVRTFLRIEIAVEDNLNIINRYRKVLEMRVVVVVRGARISNYVYTEDIASEEVLVREIKNFMTSIDEHDNEVWEAWCPKVISSQHSELERAVEESGMAFEKTREGFFSCRIGAQLTTVEWFDGMLRISVNDMKKSLREDYRYVSKDMIYDFNERAQEMGFEEIAPDLADM